MNSKEYVLEAIRTKSDQFHSPIVDNWLVEPPQSRLSADVLHALVGISTEAGELLDAAKKALFYGRAVDYVNLDEEMGDVLWYLAIYCNARNITLESLMAQNIAKLRSRYPESFTEQAANNRDLFAERETLEANATSAPKQPDDATGQPAEQPQPASEPQRQPDAPKKKSFDLDTGEPWRFGDNDDKRT